MADSIKLTKDESRIGRVESVLCPTCKVLTNHTVQGSFEVKRNREIEIEGGTIHDLLSCNGCSTGTYRRSSWNSEGSSDGVTTLYPSRGETEPARTPKDFAGLAYGGALESAYRQTVAAFNGGLLTLAGSGVRLLLEGICRDHGITEGDVTDPQGVTKKRNSLEGRINGMVSDGLITQRQAAGLHEIRMLGNDAAHCLDMPPKRVVDTAITVVEHVLHQVYDQSTQGKLLSNRERPAKKSN